MLSQALIAFVIELDNEFEHRMPHRTTDHGPSRKMGTGPWAASVAMWSTCLQFVGPTGIRVRDLERPGRARTNLNGMERWGYVTVEPDPDGARPSPPRSHWLVRATNAGRRAAAVWCDLFGIIEQRWEARFGAARIDQLRGALRDVDARLDPALPDTLPVLGYGLRCDLTARCPPLETPGEPKLPGRPGHVNFPQRSGDGDAPSQSDMANATGRSAGTDHAGRRDGAEDSRSLYALLSRVLLAFTIEFEAKSQLSLAIGANVVRVAQDDGVLVRDLPQFAAVSKEAIAVAASFLSKGGYAVLAPPPGSRFKALTLTPKGRQAPADYGQRVVAIEERWCAALEPALVDRLRAALEAIVVEPAAAAALLGGTKPNPDGWRAAIPARTTLAHQPVVTHRGGYPDGS
jgi:DNA-binding MarR family transcriptional regulator